MKQLQSTRRWNTPPRTAPLAQLALSAPRHAATQNLISAKKRPKRLSNSSAGDSSAHIYVARTDIKSSRRRLEEKGIKLRTFHHVSIYRHGSIQPGGGCLCTYGVSTTIPVNVFQNWRRKETSTSVATPAAQLSTASWVSCARVGRAGVFGESGCSNLTM